MSLPHQPTSGSASCTHPNRGYPMRRMAPRVRGRPDHVCDRDLFPDRDRWLGLMAAGLVGVTGSADGMRHTRLGIRPFPQTLDPWDAKHTRALRTGHRLSSACDDGCEPVLVRERTGWGWLSWTVPEDGTPPEVPHEIAVIAPGATRIQRALLRRLTRRPALRLTSRALPGSVRRSTVCAAIVSLLVGLAAIHAGLAVDVALPAMALIPLLIERLEGFLDAKADEHVRHVQGEAACRYTHRLAILQYRLDQLGVRSDACELRRAAEIGHGLLWDAAVLLRDQDTRSASSALIAREMLMLRLVDQAVKFSAGIR